ncbi:hypothetical protein KFK09_011058 [Dendrobium nobile]|uniref:Uncharacterized protein n=1 Tax=Dendrobium nobile TaxID=94219 RepID=A0A8T3BBS5_DENNO|nr:hypothetical protein KFK09_011058 [Dendrobium nobile]
MDRLVKVEAAELELHFRPSYRCTATFKITSLIHTMPVAVKLSTVRPSFYSFSPDAVALLPPLSSAVFTVVLLPTAEPPLVSPPDVVFVGTALAPALQRANSVALRHFFSRPALPIFRDASLPIHIIGPHALRSLLLGSGSTSSLLASIIPSCTPPELSAALLLAAGDSSGGNAVSALLSAGANPNSRRAVGGRSAIALAVSAGCAESVEVLVKAGAADRPLNEAAAVNRTDLILFLLAESDLGLDWADMADADGRTPVHAAAAEGSVDALRLCLSCGGDPERTDARGWTPLHYAAAGGHLEATSLLIKSSDFNPRLAVTRGGKWWLRRKTAFDIAVNKGHSHLFDILRPEDELIRAARCGKVAAVSASPLIDEAVLAEACLDQPVWESHGEAASAAALVNTGN